MPRYGAVGAMMGLRIPSPRDGWRVFAGEVGVIVLGVLLALGAQQAVESWQVRQDTTAFRETIDEELGHNLFMRQVRDRQVSCDLRQTAEAGHENILAFASLAKEIGIRPVFPNDHRRDDIAAAMACHSILTPPQS